MRLQKLTHLLASASLVILVGGTSVQADDTEIYLNSSSSSASQNILFNLDTSGSMGSTVDEDNSGSLDPGERSRMEVLREAMLTVLDSLPSLNAGLMRYHYYGGPILYPVASLDEEACVVEGNCTATTSASGDIIVTNNLASDADDAVQEGAAGLIIDGTSLQIGTRPGGMCDAGSGSVRISSSADDAESDVPDGGFTSTSSDLEIPRERGEQQVVGLRFRDVDIPDDATITNAYIEFEVDQVNLAFSEGYLAPIDVLIKAETMAGSRDSFSSSSGREPEDRLANNPSIATVNWETDEFPGQNQKLTTNNISPLLQEYVDDPAWPTTGGDDMVFLFVQDPTASSSDNGSRELESYNGESSAAPLLVYEYEDCTNPTAATEMRTGLRFTGVSVPQGSTITSARIDFTTFNDSAADALEFRVQVENADDAAPYATTQLLENRTFVGSGEDWNSTSTPPLTQWLSSDNTLYATPDLTTQVQAVVNRSGWCGGNAMSFMIERPTGPTGIRYAYSMENDDSKAPILTIEYDADTPQAGANGCVRSTIVETISSGNDDAEESATGNMNISSSDLEMVDDGSDQTVGLRFTGLPIAQGATITSAKLVFTADETDTTTTNLTIRGELSEDARSFSSTNGNITDTTDRPRTSASVSWTPGNWNTVGQTHEATGLGPIVQEIVGQSGWAPGNDLVMFVSGSGKRVADSYDGNPATAVRLIVEFEGSPVESKVTVRQKMKDIVDGLIQAGGTPIAGTMIEAAHYFRGEGVRYGTQRGTQSSTYRNSNVSHPASYDANGATVTYPGSCDTDNEAHDDCKTQEITGGNPVYKSPIIAECQANYLVNLTDGGGYYTGDGLTNQRGQSMDEQDLINAFVAKDDDGNTVSMPTCNTDTTLPDGTVFSGSSHNECTVKLAKFLHDYDQIYSSAQNLQSGTSPIAGSQTLDIYTIGFNMCGTGNVSSQFDDGSGTLEQVCCDRDDHNFTTGLCSSPIADPSRIQVLKAQAAVAGGEYYNASTVDELVAAFTNITSNIVEKSTSFVAPSIAANAFNRLLSRDDVYFGLFEPSKTQRWDGNTKKYNICTDTDIDDDGTADCNLGDVLDATNTPAVVSDPLAADFGLFSVAAESEWTGFDDGRETKVGGAGGEITDYAANPGGRIMYTEVNNSGQAPINQSLDDTGYKVTAANWASGDLTAVRDQVCPTPSTTDGSDCDLRMQFLLGGDSQNEDDDTSTNTRWWHHDVLHSSPVAITYGKTSGGTFIDKILVGTNDGGLHFINGHTGKEEWFFMPNALLAGQQSFYDNASSAHTYGLDSSPVIGIIDKNQDGTIDADDGDFVGVIIGQRRGGSNLYALDLSPDSGSLSTTNATVDPKFLWHISPARLGYDRLGQTWSEPRITTIRTTSGPKQVIIFGGGYDPDLDQLDGGTPTEGKNFRDEAGTENLGNAIYIADVDTGDLIFSISSSAGADIRPTDMRWAIPSNVEVFDSDGDGFTDRLYVGDTGGQLWRVDLKDVNPTSTTAPEGKTVVGKLADISVVASGTRAQERRFFYKPTVVQVIDTVYSDTLGGEYDYVLIGTGNRANPVARDVEDRFYAFRDMHTAEMGDSNNDNIADAYPVQSDGSDNSGPITNSSALIDVSTTVLDPSTSQGALGWYIDFNNASVSGGVVTREGEKVLAASGVFAGTLIFTSYVPDDPANISNICSAAEGSGRAYNLNILSTAATLDWDENGSISPIGDRSIALGGGIPSQGVPVFTNEGVTVLVGSGGGALNLEKVSEVPRGSTYWNQQH